MHLVKMCMLFVTSAIITGCIIAPTNLEDGQALQPNEGIVVMRLHSNWDGHSNPLLAKIEYIYGKVGESFNSGEFVMTREKDLKVIALPAGKYRWALFNFGTRELSFDSSRSGFTVEEGKMIYLGDIYTHLELGKSPPTAEFRVTNDFETIKQELQAQYPKLANRYKPIVQITTLQPLRSFNY